MNPNRLLLALTLGVLSSVACSSTPSDDARPEHTLATRSAVIKGKASDASQDAVVLVMHFDRNDPAGVGQCTGTLLAPRLVLTARHCVGDTDPYAACKPDGTPIQAGVVRSNFAPETMRVYTGKDRPDFHAGNVKTASVGAKILDDGGKNLCNHDIALILLKDPIDGVPIAPIRLDADVTKGELLTVVGWGVTEKTPFPDERQQRTGVKVKSVGPDKDPPGVPPNEFEVGESICSGDSGGPALAQATGAVVGVVSRGGNADTDADPNDPAARCIGGTNLYTKVAPFKDLILQGYELAEAEPWIEGGPDPRKAKTGEECASEDECRSNLCLPDPAAGGATTCAEDCSETEECTVEGEICTAEGEAMVCRAPKKPDPAPPAAAGCASSGGSRGGAGGATLLLGLFAVASLRRRGLS